MILSDKRILEEMEKGTIKVAPYKRICLGSTSYDVNLGKWLTIASAICNLKIAIQRIWV